eukprot:4846596-Pyramimonas_sp.AAC.1
MLKQRRFVGQCSSARFFLWAPTGGKEKKQTHIWGRGGGGEHIVSESVGKCHEHNAPLARQREAKSKRQTKPKPVDSNRGQACER